MCIYHTEEKGGGGVYDELSAPEPPFPLSSRVLSE